MWGFDSNTNSTWQSSLWLDQKSLQLDRPPSNPFNLTPFLFFLCSWERAWVGVWSNRPEPSTLGPFWSSHAVRPWASLMGPPGLPIEHRLLQMLCSAWTFLTVQPARRAVAPLGTPWKPNFLELLWSSSRSNQNYKRLDRQCFLQKPKFLQTFCSV